MKTCTISVSFQGGLDKEEECVCACDVSLPHVILAYPSFNHSIQATSGPLKCCL